MSDRAAPAPPPRLTPPPAQPRWEDLPTRQREELLQHLGRMLAARLAAPDAPKGVKREPR